jgi:hypothetical protein
MPCISIGREERQQMFDSCQQGVFAPYSSAMRRRHDHAPTKKRLPRHAPEDWRRAMVPSPFLNCLTLFLLMFR